MHKSCGSESGSASKKQRPSEDNEPFEMPMIDFVKKSTRGGRPNQCCNGNDEIDRTCSNRPDYLDDQRTAPSSKVVHKPSLAPNRSTGVMVAM